MDWNTPTSNSSAQKQQNQFWWNGGNVAGPAQQSTNSLRYKLGNFVESIGNAIPGAPEGRLSETIAGGPTRNTGAYASEGLTTSPTTPSLIGPAYTGPVQGPQPVQQVQPQNSNDPMAGFSMDFYQGWNPDAARADWLATGGAKGRQGGGGSEVDAYRQQMENSINNAYSGYFGQLDQILAGYPQAQANQEQIVNNSFNQSLSDLNASNQDSLNTLSSQERKVEENQVKTLRDLADNIMNQYRAGNVYLGTRGAGDSSAAEMYSYALNKMGNKQRGDVTAQTADIKNDINDRVMKVKNIYTQELGRLNTEKQNAMIQLGEQFRQAQDQLRMLKANGELSKGTDLANLSQTLLNNALNQMNTIQANIQAKQNALQEWAMSNSKSVGELKSNMAQLGNFNPTMPVAQTINVRPQAQTAPTTNLFGYGTPDEQKNLFGMGNSRQDFENNVFGGWGNGLLNR